MFAIAAYNIDVRFRSPTHRTTSLKEYVVTYFRRRLSPEHEFCALNGVSVHVEPGECVGLIGHNGSGKSTLLRVLAGIITPQRGKVTRNGRIASLIELGAGFDPELSGVDNVFLACSLMGLSKKEIEHHLDSIFEFADLNEFRHFQLKNYSSGMYARLGFACATVLDPDILLVDEVLAVGDERFQQKCFKRIRELRESKKAIILVSHDMHAVSSFCNRVYLLDHGQLVYEGSVDEGIWGFRKLLAGIPVNEIHQSDKIKENQFKKAGFLSAAEVGSASASGSIQTGEPWFAQLTFDKGEFTANEIICGIAFYSIDGTRLGGINSNEARDYSFDISVAEQPDNKITYRFAFKTCPFHVGDYFLETVLHTPDGRFLEHKKSAVQFSVQFKNFTNPHRDFFALGAL